MVSTATTYHACDSCGHEVSGYSKKDLLTDGWRWHDIGDGQFFVMCGLCEEIYERRRTAKVAA